MLNAQYAHTPVSTVCDTRVTTHLALRDKAEHIEHARVFCQWASPISCKISVSETVHILLYIERFRNILGRILAYNTCLTAI